MFDVSDEYIENQVIDDEVESVVLIRRSNRRYRLYRHRGLDGIDMCNPVIVDE
jgi:hypothetical protein